MVDLVIEDTFWGTLIIDGVILADNGDTEDQMVTRLITQANTTRIRNLVHKSNIKKTYQNGQSNTISNR